MAAGGSSRLRDLVDRGLELGVAQPLELRLERGRGAGSGRHATEVVATAVPVETRAVVRVSASCSRQYQGTRSVSSEIGADEDRRRRARLAQHRIDDVEVVLEAVVEGDHRGGLAQLAGREQARAFLERDQPKAPAQRVELTAELLLADEAEVLDLERAADHRVVEEDRERRRAAARPATPRHDPAQE